MLRQALRHFGAVILYDLAVFFDLPRKRPHSISGGDYWQYRIAVERMLFSVLLAFFLINSFVPRYIESPATSWKWAAVTAVLAILESIRLNRKLKGQLEFEELFYG